MAVRPSSIGLLWLAGVLACYRGSPPARQAPDPTNHTADAARPLFVVTEAGVGPIRAGVRVTVDALRPRFPGYDLKAQPGWSRDDDVSVYKDGELLLRVVPRDEDGLVLTVHVWSPRIESKSGWRVGTALDDVQQLGGCQCFPAGAIACHDKSTRVLALVNDDDDLCDRMLREEEAAKQATIRLGRGDPAALATMRGRRIKELQWFAVSWKPEP